MKKIFLSLLAIAALTACSKSDVQYSDPAEIGFAPATKNITKAANEAGTLLTTEKLGVWAFWNGTNGATPETSATYANYTSSYLTDATFVNRSQTANWGGDGVAYPWPTNGALVFAGYTKPVNQTENFSVEYTLNDNTATTDISEADVMTFNNYTQSTETANTYDLCWFGRTSSSYNYRADGTPVSVTLSHALTWITFNVKGKSEASLPVTNKWKVTKVILNDIKNVGTGICTGATATWSFAEDASSNDISVYPNNSETGVEIPATATAVESTTNGVVVIPQAPTTVTVEWEYPVGSVTMKDSKTLPLTLSEGAPWKAGIHYTYTIVFDSNEILVAPSYGEWGKSDQTITVE